MALMLACIKQDVRLISGSSSESLEIKLWLDMESMSDLCWISQKRRRSKLGLLGGCVATGEWGAGVWINWVLAFPPYNTENCKTNTRRRNPISFLFPHLFINRWLFLISSDEMHNGLPWDSLELLSAHFVFFIYTIGFLSKQTYEDIDFLPIKCHAKSVFWSVKMFLQ